MAIKASLTSPEKKLQQSKKTFSNFGLMQTMKHTSLTKSQIEKKKRCFENATDILFNTANKGAVALPERHF